MFKINTANAPRMHPSVAGLLNDAQAEIGAAFDKQRTKVKAMQADLEKRVLAGDVDALKQYRQLVRIQQGWKHVKARFLSDIREITDVVTP